MNQTNIRKLFYHIKHRYVTMNNVVIAVALLVAAGWAWGSITTMQRNYALQSELDNRNRQLELTALEVATLQYQQNYYRSNEYKELAARERLGLAAPGEKLLTLPPNSPGAIDQPVVISASQTTKKLNQSNFEQWMNFLFGNSAESLQK